MLLPSEVTTRVRSLPAARVVPSLRARIRTTDRVTMGRTLTLAAFVGTSLGGVLAKSVYATGAEPVSFVTVRLLAAVAFLAAVGGLRRVPVRTAARLLALGVGFGLQTIAFYTAISLSPVALVVVTVSAYPTIVVAMDAIATRTRPSGGRMLLMGASLVGLWLAAGSPVARPEAGVLLAIGGAFSYALYLRVSERVLVGVPPIVGTWWVMAGGLLLLVVAAVVTTPAWPSATGVGLAAIHGVVATALPVVAVYAALQRIRSTDVAALAPLEPVMATGLAVMVLGERLALTQIAGAALVLLVVALLAGARPRAVLPRLPLSPVGLARRRRRRAGDEAVAHGAS